MRSLTTTNPKRAMPTPTGRSILPLPDDVVAHITSSTAIVSLTGVVLELLKNSLDAKATRVEAAVDFARGGCVVEDNGLGITPLEFAEDGGLGRLYCTSKYHANEPVLGRNGTFLASLAAMSLLTIASHHHEYRSHNAVTFHHAAVVDRQLPAATHHDLHGSHGTRVTVRNLFGNMPVRVKQRSIVAAQKPEHEKLWDGLKRDVVSLLLSWQGTVSVRVRDGNNKTILNLNTSGPSVSKTDKSTAEARPAQLGSLLNVLTQANYIAIDEWSSWVPVSASTSAISVEGAISLNPAPSKHVQFISLGPRPLSPDHGHNELFDHVNRLFALSSFGTVDEEALDEREKRRRESDRRFKKDGYTTRQLKTRKDVDRYPMFHLRILLAEADGAALPEDQFVGNQTDLQNAMDVVEAMLTQWLTVHHFRPRQSRKKRDARGMPSSMFSDAAESDTSASTRRSAKPKSNSIVTGSKRKRSKDSSSHEPPGKLHRGAFAEWSRIKSGKSEFFNSLPTRQKSKDRPSANEHDHTAVQHPIETDHSAPLAMKPIAKGAFSRQPMQDRPAPEGDGSGASEKENDDTILWKDPSTGNTYLLNARTGCVTADPRPRPNTDSSAPMFRPDQRPASKSIRLPNRASTTVARHTPWLDEVLRDWENPVFKPSEQRIQQITIHEDVNQKHGFNKHGCSRLTDEAFDANTTIDSSKFSKESLRNAHVISQVDKKFILVKMHNTSLGSSRKGEDMLVLIDQHAADERVQVEFLFEQLCTPFPSTANSSQSQLGHHSRIATTPLEKPLSFTISAQEESLLTTHAARFAAWGILYDTSSPPASQSAPKASSSIRRESLVSITSLPPVIAQRCLSEPKILISLLRSTVWSYADEHVPPLSASSHPCTQNQEQGLQKDDTKRTKMDASSWVTQLSSCPLALIQLVHSRACRSALMFNDELGLDECKILVKKLARCVFPFMCAHGRPSMVPLLGLGLRDQGWVMGGLGRDDDADGGEDRTGFLEAWKEWRR